MNIEKVKEMILNLKADGIYLEDISKELDYRDNAIEGARWDDNLYDYSTEELDKIEELWCEVA